MISMGNFQYLAVKVLERQSLHFGVPKVSNFSPLGKETGNFVLKKGNLTGNSKITTISKTHIPQGFHMETDMETNGKPIAKLMETPVLQNGYLSFLSASTRLTTIERFFDDADRFEIQLLQDDKRWIKDVCHGIPL